MNEIEQASADEPDSAPASDGAFGRLAGVILSPFATFERIAERPNWLVPLVAWIVVSLLLFAGVGALTDPFELTRNQLRDNPFTGQLTEEQIDEIARQSLESWGSTLGQYVGTLIVSPLLLLIVGALLWVLLLILGTDPRFGGVVSITAHALFAYSLINGALILAVFYFAEDPNKVNMADAVSSNLGVFVDSSEQPVLHRLLASFDLLILYFVFLVGLGLSKMSRRISLPIGMTAAAMIYGLYVGPVLLLTALIG